MAIGLSLDDEGHLRCDVGGSLVTAYDAAASADALLGALDRVESQGAGDCFWHHATGQYRWAFRKENGTVRIAVMWSTGVVTGWEHVWWGEADWAAFSSEARGEIARIKLQVSTL